MSVCRIFGVLLICAAFHHAHAGLFDSPARFLQVSECDESGKAASGTSYLFPLDKMMWVSSSDGKRLKLALHVVDDLAGRTLMIDPIDLTALKQITVGQFSHHSTCTEVTGTLFSGKKMNSEVIQSSWQTAWAKCDPARPKVGATNLAEGLTVFGDNVRVPKNRKNYMLVCKSPLIEVKPAIPKPASVSYRSKEKFAKFLLDSSSAIQHLLNPSRQDPTRAFRLPYIMIRDSTNWQASILNNKIQQQWFFPALDSCLAATNDKLDVEMSETKFRMVAGDAVEFEMCHNAKNIGRVPKGSVSNRLGLPVPTYWEAAYHSTVLAGNLKVEKVLGAFQVTLLDVAGARFGPVKAKERLLALGWTEQDFSWCLNCFYHQQASERQMKVSQASQRAYDASKEALAKTKRS